MTTSGSTRPRKTSKLGLSERWSLARKRIGSPVIVLYHASLPSGLVSLDDLRTAAASLLHAYPILSHIVPDHASSHPSYRAMKHVDVEDIVSNRRLEATRAELFEQVCREGYLMDMEKGPLLRIQLHRGRPRDSLVLFFDHIICDGLGGRNLFSDLLSLISRPCTLPSSGLPSRLDDDIDLSPDQPKLPTLSCDYPATQPGYHPLFAPAVFSEVVLSPADLSKLISVGKSHDIPTLQPIFHMAALFALFLAAESSTALALRSSTPISERDFSIHPRSAGNYVTFHYSTTLVESGTVFWEEARKFSDVLRDSASRIGARATLGAFSLLKGAEWDTYLGEMVQKANSNERMAMAISNVGRLELPEGRLEGQVEDVFFSQSPSAVGGAMVLSVMSCTDGPLSISISSKEGALPSGVLSGFVQSLSSIFTALVQDRVEEEATLESLTL